MWLLVLLLFDKSRSRVVAAGVEDEATAFPAGAVVLAIATAAAAAILVLFPVLLRLL
jgi:hypothetical protein